jgi:hypothetical protein
MGKQQPKRSVDEPLGQLPNAGQRSVIKMLAGQQRQQLLLA